MITPAAEIPTVSLLYHLKKLLPAASESDAVTPQPSQSLNDRIGLIRGDITKLKVDAIVNAANKTLLGGGGVDGAIHAAAGPELLEECRTLDGCDTGSAKITDAYELPCKKVIHAVGPIYDWEFADVSEEKLSGCYTSSLKLAVENKCRTVAFSALSTGVYGYPSHEAAPVAIRAVRDFLEGEDGDKLDKVVFVTFVGKDVDAYNYWLPLYFPSIEPDNGHEEEWEEVEGEESAENGVPESQDAGNSEDAKIPSQTEKEDPKTEGVGAGSEERVQLPDVPTGEPDNEGPATKKHKSEA